MSAAPMHLVLFDVDGTLIDSQHVIVAAMERAFHAVGRVAPPRADILGIVGLSLEEAAARLLGPGGGPVHAIAEAYKAAFFELRGRPDHQEPLFPGARAVLDDLAARRDLVLGIATGKSRRGLRAVLDRHDLQSRFVTIQTADEHPSKPHPSMIRAALAETGVPAERTVMIGDTTYDVDMARAAGVVAIGVGWGYQDRDWLTAAGAVTVLDGYGDVMPTLGRLFGW